MFEGQPKKPAAVLGLLQPAGSVLIRSGEGDEAFSYQASLGSTLGPTSFLVYFHLTSLLVERVRLFGSIAVFIEFAGASKFMGELKLSERPWELEACDRRTVLVLELNTRVDVDMVMNERICPMT